MSIRDMLKEVLLDVKNATCNASKSDKKQENYEKQFVGCFTEDLDHPTDMPIIYMLFKCDKVTQNSINSINRIEKCKNLHTTRYKMIDSTNCVAYGFMLTGKRKSLITGNGCLLYTSRCV